jgi:3-oxoacyl-[acyl-carrier protein] reductase
MSILITHATQYAGPGSVDALRKPHPQIFCHDASFADPRLAAAFEQAHAGTLALTAQDPEAIAAELQQRGAAIETLIHNDVYPNQPAAIEKVHLDALRASIEALLVFPWQLTQLLMPAMKQRRSGRIIFITSARYLQPEEGFAVATSVRAATTQFALALARECAPHQISVNVIAPNFLASEAYYPRAKYVESEEGRAFVANHVPFGRLGTAEEMGALVAFLAAGDAPFVTGQVIHFTGGWP